MEDKFSNNRCLSNWISTSCCLIFKFSASRTFSEAGRIAPYLTPVPFRGKPNESSYMIHVAEKLAEIKSCTLAEIAAQTTANSKNIFGI